MSFYDGRATGFDPPYDSEIEEIFIWNVIKYLNGRIKIIPQYEIPTTHGCFKIDFAIILKDKIVGIECDGKDYHEITRDRWRDAIILNKSNVSDIFRLRGCDIKYSIEECLYIISWYYPEIFDQKGMDDLMKLIDIELVNEKSFKELLYLYTIIPISYKKGDQVKRIEIYRHNKKLYDFKRIIELTSSHPSSTVDEIYEKYKE